VDAVDPRRAQHPGTSDERRERKDNYRRHSSPTLGGRVKAATQSVTAGFTAKPSSSLAAFRFVPFSELGELMESEDERVSVIACNALLDRAFGKPKAAVEEKDDMDAQLASMTREERLALMQQLLEPMRRYLPPGEEAAVVDGEAGQDRIRRRREDRGDT
jgi:hypothetical protein